MDSKKKNKRQIAEVKQLQKIAGLLKEDRELTFVKAFQGGDPGDPGYGEEYEEARVYEKGGNVVFKMGDPGHDGVPSTVFVMKGNIYHAMDILAKEGYPVLDGKIEVDPENEYAVEDLLLDLESKGIVVRFSPEEDIHSRKDVDTYNSYLPDDEQYSYEDFGGSIEEGH